jgi:hypothetical protein
VQPQRYGRSCNRLADLAEWNQSEEGGRVARLAMPETCLCVMIRPW